MRIRTLTGSLSRGSGAFLSRLWGGQAVAAPVAESAASLARSSGCAGYGPGLAGAVSGHGRQPRRRPFRPPCLSGRLPLGVGRTLAPGTKPDGGVNGPCSGAGGASPSGAAAEQRGRRVPMRAQ
ncbi:hypothetical protein SHIRM173S_02359 [Streptomyces hirsutus]